MVKSLGSWPKDGSSTLPSDKKIRFFLERYIYIYLYIYISIYLLLVLKFRSSSKVERYFPKLKVVGSSPIFCENIKKTMFFYIKYRNSLIGYNVGIIIQML